MKKLLCTLIFMSVLAFGAFAQQTQTDGTITIKIESTRIIGDQLLVSGKFVANKKVRIMSLNPTIVDKEGDAQQCNRLWLGGELASLSAFDNTFDADIPYSFDAAFNIANNKEINPLTAIVFEMFNHTSQERFKLIFKDIAVPLTPNPNIAMGKIEIEKDIFLTWTKYEETPKGLKIHFLIENLSNKDKVVAFPFYTGDGSSNVIDNEGNQYPKTIFSFKDRYTFPVKTPVAGYFEIPEPIKLSAIKLLKFKVDWKTISVTNFKFVK